METELQQTILEYLAGRDYTSIGEIFQFCSSRLKRDPDAAFYFEFNKAVWILAEENLLELKDIENHLWVKRR